MRKISFLLALTFSVTISFIDPSFAQSEELSSAQGVMDYIIGLAQGPFAISFAVVIVLIAAYLAGVAQRISWMRFAQVLIFVVMVFGAVELVDALTSAAGS